MRLYAYVKEHANPIGLFCWTPWSHWLLEKERNAGNATGVCRKSELDVCVCVRTTCMMATITS